MCVGSSSGICTGSVLGFALGLEASSVSCTTLVAAHKKHLNIQVSHMCIDHSCRWGKAKNTYPSLRSCPCLHCYLCLQVHLTRFSLNRPSYWDHLAHKIEDISAAWKP